ncbi:transglutaminase domain-containing protein [Halosimplex salinum]|uniref:transglutaminase domain-containing protein n=1 Tax=Halosimplex salinum TaxID=1710538 RepID=UPI000F4A842A|nr:transglutaminase domain-containing protein [Halosimplex salinum]
MSDADERFEFAGDAPTREYGSVALAVACVVAAVLATALVPAATSVGLGDAPAESLVPLPPGAEGSSGDGSDGSAGSGAGAGNGFGALNVGEETSVGGSIGDGDGSPFRSQDTAVHFQVRSEESSYWRTGAYDTYTGQGWSRSGPSDATSPIDGEQVRYRVELAQSAQSAPTVWRPTSLDDAEGLELTDGGLARADGSLSAGESYVGVSRKPPRDPELLRATGRDYPDAIERRYTELPPSTAVSLRPFTNNVTDGADNPYETAVRIEEWLETNKEYSLNVSEPSGENVAREFVTKMDAGYCEYFATAMTTMLRSQEIPARYVVGYSTGQQVGANTFQVRGMNAHAWVEVYFEDVGWVRFDPTPGSERLQQEQAAYEDSGAPGTYAPQESGSPGETFSPDPDAENGTETDSGTDAATQDGPVATPPPTPERPGDDGEARTPTEPGQEPASAYEVSLNRTAVPGAVVEVTVRAGAQPVVGALVEFDGRGVGRTDRDGTVDARVPYTENLTISVTGGSTVASEAPDGGAASLSMPQSVPPPDAGVLLAHARADNTTRSFAVETEASLSVSGDVRTGETVLVSATVDGVPVRNASVTLDGEQVARTNDEGRAQVSLPDSTGNVTLAVVRDPVAGERTLRLDSLAVTADPVWPLPVAGTSVEVTARLGNESVAGVPVSVGGEPVGETGVDGSLGAGIPLESSVSITASVDGQTARTTVANPLVNAAGVAVAAAGLVVGAAVALGGQSVGLRALPGRLAAVLQALTRWIVRAFVTLAVAAAVRVERTLDHLHAFVTGERSYGDTADAFRGWIAAWRARLRDGIGRSGPAAGESGEPGAESGESDAAHVTIREAWGQFLGHVSVGRPWTKTPGQLADHAVAADGLPAGAVATLRDEFRAVEYGPRSPDDSVPAVEAAIDRIERAAGEAGQNPGDEAGDDGDRSAEPEPESENGAEQGAGGD